MTKRSYDITCGIATALDIVGERWTLLIVRDLLAGPQRYTDLLESLPGIGNNLLAKRLKDLEAYGVVRKRELPPPAASIVYELTEEGEELREPLMGLGRWGDKYMQPPDSIGDFSLRTLMLGLSGLIEPATTRGLRLTVGLVVPDAPSYVLHVDDGRVWILQADVAGAEAVLAAPPEVLFALVREMVTMDEAERQAMLRIEGDRSAVVRAFELMDASEFGSRFERVRKLEAAAPSDAAGDD
jgi:DNA-binding HxlR family transcriptional regulator